MRPYHIILLIVGVSIPWLILLKNTSNEYSDNLDSLNTKISEIQLNLDEKTRINKQLVKNLSLAQKARLHAEKQQNFLYEKLRSKNEEISDLVSDDWETHYKRAKDHNDSLIRRINNLEKNHQVELKELDINQQNLLDLNDSLTNDLIRLEFEYDNLNKDSQSIISNYGKKQNQVLKNYEKKIFEQQEEIELLSLKNNSLNEIINKITGNAVDKTTKLSQPSAKTENSDYRKNRISSLAETLVNRNSNERKQILINVIPTIPDGIYAQELLAMTNNMKSSDTSQVVQSVNKYIVRPIDTEIINELTSRLTETDARLIAEILSQ